MFHFRARETFLHESAKVLRDGGRLVLSDILLRNPGEQAPLATATIEATIRRSYGPWPQLWVELDEILDSARAAGLELDGIVDATRQTLPTYRVTAPQHHDDLQLPRTAGELLRWLHTFGHLSYLCLSFTKA
jgi:hypothetical protein